MTPTSSKVPPLPPVLPVQVTARAKEPIVLPDYSGSTLRGAFGWALKDAVCVVDHGNCEECFLTQNCLFTKTFETQHLDQNNGKYSQYSHPPKGFTLRPPEQTSIDNGEAFSFTLMLFGQHAEKAEYWVHTLQTMGKRGLGPKRGEFKLEELRSPEAGSFYASGELQVVPEPLEAPTTWDQQDGFTLSFRTPTRLSGPDGLTDDPQPETLMRDLMRRLAVLSYFHAGVYWEEVRFDRYLEECRSWDLVDDSTEWRDWERYSQRRDESMKLGGIVGQAEYKGPVDQCVPLLEWGQWIHLGKNTTFGLGAYDLQWT